jgi:hypothetical protein
MALLGRFRHLRYFRFGWERTLVNRMPMEVSRRHMGLQLPLFFR